ncbi:type 1 glutamine amidotransferase domain-containing protein [Fibrisoma montanum]|uniref:type 1 glutamine amidotransferase domain-containing protein n=1 Tax=Fibrisoma montanum TaxID=2305895 RepID=UPI0013149FBF|nr:type 1 glutamine amidotransferase domain-containing protein [Fibrisoma montanum]
MIRHFARSGFDYYAFSPEPQRFMTDSRQLVLALTRFESFYLAFLSGPYTFDEIIRTIRHWKTMKKAGVLILLLVSALSGYPQSRKILIVSTNVDSVGSKKSGTFLMEIALPFSVFQKNGYSVDIVTPKGGPAAIYQSSKTWDELTQAQTNPAYLAAVANTYPPEKIQPSAYAAVYYPGGHGQFFDVLSDERIARLAAAIYENGGVVGSAGHGTASLVNIQLRDGQYFVKDKTITCFPTWAEKAYMDISQYGKLLPLDMQQVLTRRGANLVVSTQATKDDQHLTHVIDARHRVVTGTFASSAKWVAEEMLKLIAGSTR